MKLLVCANCLDVLRVQNEVRSCRCGQSAAFMHAEHQVTVMGRAIVMGLCSEDMYWGRQHIQKGSAKTQRISAHLLPSSTKNVRYAGSEVFARQIDLDIDAEMEAAR